MKIGLFLGAVHRADAARDSRSPAFRLADIILLSRCMVALPGDASCIWDLGHAQIIFLARTPPFVHVRGDHPAKNRLGIGFERSAETE